MTDPLEDLREMRSDVPAASTDSLRSMRVRMLEARRPRSWHKRLWPKALVAGGLAVGLSAVLLFGPGDPIGLYDGPEVQLGRPANAATILNRAADAVEGQQPVERPRDDQFVYTKSLIRYPNDSRTSEDWTPFWWDTDKIDPDARSPKKLWEYHETFPTEPKALRKAIYAEVRRIYKDFEGKWELHERAAWLADEMLSGGNGLPAPPEKRAALLRVLATIPGIKVETGFQDIAEREGIYVYIGKKGARDGSIYAAGTYEYLGSHAEFPESTVEGGPGGSRQMPTLTMDDALLVRKVVDHKGDR